VSLLFFSAMMRFARMRGCARVCRPWKQTRDGSVPQRLAPPEQNKMNAPSEKKAGVNASEGIVSRLWAWTRRGVFNSMRESLPQRPPAEAGDF